MIFNTRNKIRYDEIGKGFTRLDVGKLRTRTKERVVEAKNKRLTLNINISRKNIFQKGKNQGHRGRYKLEVY